MPKILIKEACIESLEQAIAAQQQGANRLELCTRLDLGGLSPGTALVKEVLEAVSIPVMVMVRNRAGDFCYSPAELREMLSQIEILKALQSRTIAGFVTGALTPEGRVDVEAMKQLAERAAPYPITFHKAIDHSHHLLQALQTLKTIPGITGVLSSGGAGTALEGAPVLRAMIQRAGAGLTIIAAGKITRENLAEVHRAIGGREYHGRLIVGPLS